MSKRAIQRLKGLNFIQTRFHNYCSGFRTFFCCRNDLYKTDFVLKSLNSSKIKNKSQLFSFYGWKRDYQFIVNLLHIGEQPNLKYLFPELLDKKIRIPEIKGFELYNENNFQNEWMGFEQNKMSHIVSIEEMTEEYYLNYYDSLKTDFF